MHRPRRGLSHGIRDVTRFFHRQFSRAPGGSVVWASRQFGGRQLALDCLDLRRSIHGGSLGQLLCHAHEIRSRSLGELTLYVEPQWSCRDCFNASGRREAIDSPMVMAAGRWQLVPSHNTSKNQHGGAQTGHARENF